MFLSLSCTLLCPIWKWFSPHSPQCHTNCWHPFKRQTFIINLLFSLRACGCAPAFVLTLDVSVRQQLFYKKIQGSMENKNVEQGRWWKFCLLKCSGVYRLVGARGIQLWSFLIGCFHSPSTHKCLSNVLFFIGCSNLHGWFHPSFDGCSGQSSCSPTPLCSALLKHWNRLVLQYYKGNWPEDLISNNRHVKCRVS